MCNIKKASDSHYKRNLKKEAIPALTGTKKSGDSGHNSELKKETREHTLVLLCNLLYNIIEGDEYERTINVS